MPNFRAIAIVTGLALSASASPAGAEAPAAEGVSVSINTLGAVADYPILTRGSVVLINAQRLVVTSEPLPLARASEAPPEPKAAELEAERPRPPSKGAIWVPGHWTYAATGYSWVAGRYVPARPGHAFVPPRWAVYEEQYLYFTGFYVPRGVYVRSHFNKYYYTGVPKHGSQTPNGAYWPVGAPTRTNSALSSAKAHDPYWPLGLR